MAQYLPKNQAWYWMTRVRQRIGEANEHLESRRYSRALRKWESVFYASRKVFGYLVKLKLSTGGSVVPEKKCGEKGLRRKERVGRIPTFKE